jgi:ubiquinone/menaquinone biosynthesis C-methylase UbiE
MATPASLYDQLPYPSYAYRATHPDHLGTIARALGLSPAAPEACRVLELGCASAGNLIPMAAGLPRASFLGVDRSAPQIALGQARAEALGLSNVSLLTADLASLDLGDAQFDYVVCHGVYS